MKCDSAQLQDFLEKHRVFNSRELEDACAVSGYHTRNLLAKLERESKIRKIRKGLYSTVLNSNDVNFIPPGLLVAAKLAPDAVLGYQSALMFHGLSRNLHNTHTFITRHRLKPYRHRGMKFRPSLPPKSLLEQHQENFGVVEASIWDTPVKVANKERTLVDLLDRQELSGGWDELVEAFAYDDSLDYWLLLEYLKLLQNPATAARVGFFLEKYRHSMNVPDDILTVIEELKPDTPEYFYRSNRHGKYVRRWNLYVPESMLTDDREESYEF